MRRPEADTAVSLVLSGAVLVRALQAFDADDAPSWPFLLLVVVNVAASVLRAVVDRRTLAGAHRTLGVLALDRHLRRGTLPPGDGDRDALGRLLGRRHRELSTSRWLAPVVLVGAALSLLVDRPAGGVRGEVALLLLLVAAVAPLAVRRSQQRLARTATRLAGS